jgi:SAM-dependent methyltransferase
MAAFKDHFSGAATGYAAFRPRYPAALAEWLAGIAPGREHAWEAGCGSGQFTGLLAERFAAVRATDASAAQIAKARPAPNVDYATAPAERSGLPDGSVDLAVAAQAAHWFDLDAYWAEVRRVIRPGGAVALIAYLTPRLEGPAGAALAAFYGGLAQDGFWPPERAEVEAGYARLPFPFEAIAAPDFEIRHAYAREELLGYVDTWSAVRALERAGGRDRFDAFAEEIRALWPDGEARVEAAFPVAVRAGRG